MKWHRSRADRSRADWALRAGGLGLLALVPVLAQALRRVELGEGHHIGPLALLVALGLIGALWAGLGLLAAGASLFEPQPMPPRSWLSPGRSRV